MRQPHSWMEYQYRFAGDNSNNKMWVRDGNSIHQLSNGSFGIIVKGELQKYSYNTFVEAQDIIDAYENDNTLQ